jgi:uncharacterized short protein YbdD (DUF466 family)
MKTGMRMASLLRAVRWYLREVSGESLYDRYLLHHEFQHPHQPPMSKTEFERWRIDRHNNSPGTRCC